MKLYVLKPQTTPVSVLHQIKPDKKINSRVMTLILDKTIRQTDPLDHTHTGD